MPSLMRFLTIVATIVAMGFAAVYSLATFVTPRTREMTVAIPAARLKAAPPETAAKASPAVGAEASADAGAATR